MILSNVAVQSALSEGDILISPKPELSAFDTTALDLHLAPNLAIPDPGRPFTFDLRRGGIAKFLKDVYPPRTIDREGGWTLAPNRFILGQTVETVSFPIRHGRPVFSARVEGKSSLARCGLLVHFTAPTIHAGFSGTITLEMINLGAYPITLYPDMEICQLIFEEVRGEPVASPSQFQGQQTPAGTAS